VRLKEARARLDAFEAQEATGSGTPRQGRTAMVSFIFWIVVAIVGLAVYFLSAWLQHP
jgi:hypothetical protein